MHIQFFYMQNNKQRNLKQYLRKINLQTTEIQQTKFIKLIAQLPIWPKL